MRPSSEAGTPASGSSGGTTGGSSSNGGTTGGSSSSRAPGGSAYAALSSALLQGMEALQLDAEAESPVARAGVSASTSGRTGQRSSSPFSPAADEQQQQQQQHGGAAVRLAPDPRRGVLRLLQGVKDPGRLKLVWSPVEGRAAAAAAEVQGQQAAGGAAFDMFAAQAAPGRSAESGGSGGGPSGGSSSSAALLSTLLGLPSAGPAVLDTPLEHRGGEFWESGARFELEVPLAGGEAGEGGAPPPPPRVGSRALPGGAQLLLVVGSSSRSGSGGGSGGGGRGSSAAAGLPCTAFWLQQRWQEGCLLARPAGLGERGAGTQLAAAAGEHSSAKSAAAALAGLLASPPGVDLRQLRRDVKEGRLKVGTGGRAICLAHCGELGASPLTCAL